MKKLSVFWTLFGAFLVLAISACCVQSTKFSPLTMGTTYTIGDTFTSDGMDFELVQFFWSNGNPSPNGEAEVSNRGLAGGAGLEVWTNNINVRFDLPADITKVSFDAGHYGGNMNLEINGSVKNFEQVSDINGTTIAGVTITCAGGYNTPGKWEFDGPITSFYVGGQEFVIDNICVK